MSLDVFPEDDNKGLETAILFHTALKQHGLTKAAPATAQTRWSKTLSKLSDRVGSSEVEATMLWYCDNLAMTGLPPAKNADEFVGRYKDIRERMLASQALGRNSKTLSSYDDLPMPSCIRAVLPEIVIITKSRWAQHLVRLLSELKHPTLERRELWFIQRVLDMYSRCFHDAWVALLSDSYGHIISFNGNPLNLCWCVSSRLYRTGMWQRWSDEWCSDPNRFNHLHAHLAHENGTARSTQ